MTESTEDQWAAWFSRRRHGDDPEQLRRTLAYLAPIRDTVIRGAGPAAGDTVLDVGCGDGLIAFAAAGAVGPAGSVIFSDVSADLLARCRELATELGIVDRCRFVQAPASDFGKLDGMSVDAVTVRSVLIYEPAKAASFTEFFRVLRPGGRLSIFEPINRFAASPDGRFLGCDVEGVADLAAKVRAVYEAIQPRDTDPMLDFDERDLLRQAEQAGFTAIHLRLDADVGRHLPGSWETALRSAGNPRIPALGEAMGQVLSPDEVARLSARLRPQFESGSRQDRMAVAYLTATKPDQSRVNGS